MRPSQILKGKLYSEKKKKTYNKNQLSLSTVQFSEQRSLGMFQQDFDISKSTYITYNFSNQNIERLSNVNIRDYKNLVDLDLSNNKLSKPQPELLYLQFLKQLNLSNNQIVKMYALSNKLEILNVSNNLIKDLSQVFPLLTNLRELNLSYNQLTSLNNLSGNKTDLELLEVHHNQIEDLEGVESMVSLQILDASYNQIKQIQNLKYVKELSNLQFFDCSENSVIQDKSQKGQLNKLVPNYLQQKNIGVYCSNTFISSQTFTLQLESQDSIQNYSNQNESFENEKQIIIQLQGKILMYQQKLKEGEEQISQLKQDKQTLQQQILKIQQSSQNKTDQNDSQHLRNAIQKNAQNIREKSKLQKELDKINAQVKQYEIIFKMVSQFLEKTFTLDQVDQMQQQFQQLIQKNQKSQIISTPQNSVRNQLIQEQGKNYLSNSEKKQINQKETRKEEKGDQQSTYQELIQLNDFLQQQNIKYQEEKQKYKKLYIDLQLENERLQEEMTETTNNFMEKIRQIEKRIENSTRVSFQNSEFQSPTSTSSQQDSSSQDNSSLDKKKNSQQKIIERVEHLKARNKKYKEVIVKLLEQRDLLKEQIVGVSDSIVRKSSHDTIKSVEEVKNIIDISKVKHKQTQ